MTAEDDDTRRARILAQRAERLAHEPQATSEAAVEDLLKVGVGDEKFGIPTHRLIATMPLPSVVAVPGSKPWMAGAACAR